MIRRREFAFDLQLGALGASLVALAFIFGETGIPQWIPRAPVLRLGLASPLTGMTRSFVAFARGDIKASFAWHPLGPMCFVASIAVAVNALVVLWGSRRVGWLGRVAGTRFFGIGVGLAFALAWVRQIKEVGI